MPTGNKLIDKSHPLSLSPTAALAQLKRIRFLSAQEAIEQLANLANTGQILWLYRKHFPLEYSRSTASAQMIFTGDQSPSINAMVANIAATYLWRMFTDPKGLTTFASYCNLEALSVRSRFITPEDLAFVIQTTVHWFQRKTREQSDCQITF